MLLQVEKATKLYDRGKVIAVDEVCFQLKAGKVYALVGESGSGKTTLARLLVGLERLDHGRIFLDEKLMASKSYHLPANRRPIGMVFQEYALFPHLTVAKNIAFGLDKLEQKNRVVRDLLRLIQLEDYAHRYPNELSGGQQQRVALARALAPQPRLLLLDEPFSSLDQHLRLQLRSDLFHVLQATQTTALFITHDTQDALAVADELLVVKEGRLLQQGTPKEIYQQPINAYVAQLFDPIVALPHSLLLLFGYSALPNNIYYLRPQHFQLGITSYATDAQVVQTSFMGTHYDLTVQVDKYQWTIRSVVLPAASVVQIGFEEEKLLCFEEEII